jgi:hypothetical protein
VIAIAFNGSFDFEDFSRTTIPRKIMTKQLGKSGKNIFTLYFYNHMTYTGTLTGMGQHMSPEVIVIKKVQAHSPTS